MIRVSGSAAAICAVVLVTFSSPAHAVDAPDAIGPWNVGHRDYFVIAPPPSHLPASTAQFYDLWYPVDAGSFSGATTTYDVFTIPPSLTFSIASDNAQEGASMSSIGNRPLIVFSHGSGSVAFQSILLCETLASHGFVVIAPTHDRNNFFDSTGTFAEIARQRPKDVSAAIDHILARNALVADDFEGAIDADRIGVTGHSFGGFTALAMASGYDDGVESIPADARVKAIFPVSPAHSALSDAELDSVSVPTCYMDGSLEPDSTTSDRPFPLTHSANRMNCWAQVIGATHTHFANICDIGQALKNGNLCPTGSAPCGPDPTNPDDYTNWNVLAPGNGLSGPYVDTCVAPALDVDLVLRLQNLYSVAFFRRYLNGETGYDSFLTQAYADTEPLINFSLSQFPVPLLGGLGVIVLVGTLSGAGALMIRRRRTG